MTKEALRTRVEAELLSGVEPKDLGTKYDIPYVTVLHWKKKLLAETPTTVVSDLTQQTKASLEVIRDVAVREAPLVAGKIDAIIDGVMGLKELEPEFLTAMTKAVSLAQTFLDAVDDEGVSTVTINEWKTITTTLAMAYGTLYNKSGTTVNVAQTTVNTDSENLKFFSASKRSV